MNDKFYIEVHCSQKSYGEERICGDVFLSRRIREENRTIVVLSDGMGHGVKANVLATLTSTMALNFTQEHKEPEKIAEIIMNTLPVCSERRMSYSTFTIIDITEPARVTILEYDNPETIIMRGDEPYDPEWINITLKTERNSGKEIRTCSFEPKKEDRIFICSDGITQSGLGSSDYPFGWGRDNVVEYIKKLVSNNSLISARRISSKVVNMANRNDGFFSMDDSSCTTIYFRKPRKILICTGPPYEKDKDAELGEIVRNYEGKKVICGATTADIISRELGLTIKDSMTFDDPELPPISLMDGIDLVTEGILTLTKVTRILRDHSNSYQPGKGPADKIVNLILESDEIDFIIGTRVNIAHQDPSLPVELEMRRTVVKRMAKILEEKFLKEIKIRYI